MKGDYRMNDSLKENCACCEEELSQVNGGAMRTSEKKYDKIAASHLPCKLIERCPLNKAIAPFRTGVCAGCDQSFCNMTDASDDLICIASER